MLALLSRLVMYSSFSFTTYTRTMHWPSQRWAAHKACTCLDCLSMQSASDELMQEGLYSLELQCAHLLKHAVSALKASLLLRYLRKPCAQLCHLQRSALCNEPDEKLIGQTAFEKAKTLRGMHALNDEANLGLQGCLPLLLSFAKPLLCPPACNNSRVWNASQTQ